MSTPVEKDLKKLTVQKGAQKNFANQGFSGIDHRPDFPNQGFSGIDYRPDFPNQNFPSAREERKCRKS